jgi:hypothetical protein
MEGTMSLKALLLLHLSYAVEKNQTLAKLHKHNLVFFLYFFPFTNHLTPNPTP